jgi:hypothetical protein
LTHRCLLNSLFARLVRKGQSLSGTHPMTNSRVDTLLEGLERTHAAGLRYPVPAYMNYSPGFAFEKAAIERAGGTIEKK